MLRLAPIAFVVLAAACGRSDEQALSDAANQSEPAAAAVLNNAAEERVDPHVAMEKAGEAAQESEMHQQERVQARPNLPGDPNRPEPGEELDTIPVGANAQNRQ